MYRPTYDVSVASQVTDSLGFQHTVLTLGDEFLREGPRYIERAVYCSDGYLGLSGAAELYLNSLAREIAPIRLTGNFGSELLRGARAFKAGIPQGDLLSDECAGLVREAEGQFARLSEVPSLSFTLFHQVPHQGYGRRNIEASQVSLRTPFLDNELAALLYFAPREGAYRLGYDLSVALIGQEASQLLRIPTDRGQLGPDGSCRGALLHLARELTFKGEYWVGHGMPRWVARATRLMPATFIEGTLLGRHKFQHFRRWFKTELADYVRSHMNLHDALSPFIRSREWSLALRNQLEGRTNLLNEIDHILTLNIAAHLLVGDGAASLLQRRDGTRA
jgi:asparagine synthase (glutamine-hydrolysing)